MPQIHGVSKDDYINAVSLPVSVTSFFCVCLRIFILNNVENILLYGFEIIISLISCKI